MISFKFILPGRPPAKSNSYRIVRVGKFARLVPTPEVVAYEQSVAAIAARQRELLGGPNPLIDAPYEVELALTWHRADRRRKDLDNIAKAIKDGMTTGGIWHDDSQVTTLLLHSVQDAFSVESEWVDVYVRAIPSTASCSPTASRKSKSRNASAISNAPAAPSTSVPATSGAKSGTTRPSRSQSAPSAAGGKKSTEPSSSSPRRSCSPAAAEPR